MSDTLFTFDGAPTDAPEPSHPAPERRLHGNPLRQTWNRLDAPIAGAERIYSGIWTSEPGHWRIAMGPTEREVFTVLQGRCRVHRADGTFDEAGPGTSLHIPPGFTGSFEVIEAVTKAYVIVE